MPVVIPPSAFEVSVIHAQSTALGSSPTWTLAFSGDPTDTWFENWVGWLEAEYKDQLSSAYTITGLRIAQAGGATTIPLAVSGARSTLETPPQVSVLIKKGTATLGRSGRGRMYWPGYAPVGHVDEAGLLSEVLIGDINDVLEAMNDAINAGEVTPVLLHAGSSDPTDIVRFVLEGQVATQRRRLR